jgi:hypothetical protein
MEKLFTKADLKTAERFLEEYFCRPQSLEKIREASRNFSVLVGFTYNCIHTFQSQIHPAKPTKKEGKNRHVFTEQCTDYDFYSAVHLSKTSMYYTFLQQQTEISPYLKYQPLREDLHSRTADEKDQPVSCQFDDSILNAEFEGLHLDRLIQYVGDDDENKDS